MVLGEDSGVHRLPPRGDNGQIEAIAEEVRAGLWAKLPGWAKGTIAVLGVLMGGGGVAAKFIPYELTPVWETKTDAATEHKAIRDDLAALRGDLPVMLEKALDGHDKKRGHR